LQRSENPGPPQPDPRKRPARTFDSRQARRAECAAASRPARLPHGETPACGIAGRT